jgi:hypothetical protein
MVGGVFLLTLLAGCTTSETLRMGQIDQEGYFQAVDKETASTVNYSYSSEVEAGKEAPYTKGYEEQYDAFTVLLKHDMPARVDSLTRRYLQERTGGIDSTSATALTVELRDFKRAKWVPGDKGEKLSKSLDGKEVMSKYAAKLVAAVYLEENETMQDSTTIRVEVEEKIPAGGGVGSWEKIIGKMNTKYMDNLGEFMGENEI